jgi:bla regulator protein blaR1
MANWSQSQLLQSIGWSILNSLWQMAFLWCLYLVIVNTCKPSSKHRYSLAVVLLSGGASWSLFSFINFEVSASPASSALISALNTSDLLISNFLSAASIAYLGLLIFPAYKLFNNYAYVKHIKNNGLKKADFQYRFFVQKIASRLEIKKSVSVFVSELITSPLTIGYLKPVILLPVAALNHLSVQQVEAILLHELSHIRRLDYLVNLVMSVISTIFYFNPFVRQFMKAIDEERENCCDEMVLQFEYDKVGYATALFTLEKISSGSQVLAIAATGKNSLKKRIEKMAGMENNNQFSFRQVAGLLTAFLFIVAFNSIIIVKNRNTVSQDAMAGRSMVNPFLFIPGEAAYSAPDKLESPVDVSNNIASAKRGEQGKQVSAINYEAGLYNAYTPGNQYQFIAADDVDASLSIAQKEQVSTTVKTTKKIMKNLQWKEIESQIGEVMTPTEKAIAREEYNQEVENLNWENIERNLKAQYQKVDWTTLNGNMKEANNTMQLDSIYNNNRAILTQIEIAESDIAKANCTVQTPMPDASVTEIMKFKKELKTNLRKIENIREKRVIRL